MDGESRISGFRRFEFEPSFASAWFHELESHMSFTIIASSYTRKQKLFLYRFIGLL